MLLHATFWFFLFVCCCCLVFLGGRWRSWGKERRCFVCILHVYRHYIERLDKFNWQTGCTRCIQKEDTDCLPIKVHFSVTSKKDYAHTYILLIHTTSPIDAIPISHISKHSAKQLQKGLTKLQDKSLPCKAVKLATCKQLPRQNENKQENKYLIEDSRYFPSKNQYYHKNVIDIE